MTSKTIERVFKTKAAMDGDGVKMRRIGGAMAHPWINPFLMLDEFKSDQPGDYIGGFPPHPHRGFETITLIKHGRMRHEDHLGNQGVIQSGDVQWMTAGRGVVHSEMPEQQDGLLHGFQLWLNLPAAEKLKPAAYQDIKAVEIPSFSLAAARLRLLAGSLNINQNHYQGLVRDRTVQPIIADLEGLSPADGEALNIAGLADKQVGLYVYAGAVTVDGEIIQAGEYAVLSAAVERFSVQGQEPDSALLLLAGNRLDEPIAQHGPFVMNTRQEIETAMREYRSGDFLNTATVSA